MKATYDPATGHETITQHDVASVIQYTNEDRHIDRADVPKRVQAAMVWHAIASFPGCLGDNHAVARSREDVLGSIEYWLDEEHEYSARYVRGQLRRNGICELRDGRIITLDRHAISELF